MRTMAIFQFVGLSACRTSQQLIAETDAHARTDIGRFDNFTIWRFTTLRFKELTNVFYRHIALFRVAGTVGQEKAVELQLVEIVVPRDANHLNTPSNQTAYDVRLYAAIHMNRDANSAAKYNPQTDCIPLFGDISSKGKFFEVVAEAAGVKKEDILNALESGNADFEDAVIIESAKRNGLDTIITRNISDFKNANLNVLSPAQIK